MCSRCGEHSPSPQGPTAASVHWLPLPTWVLSPPTEYFTTQPDRSLHPLHTLHCWRFTAGEQVGTHFISLDHMTWLRFMTSLMLGEYMNQYPFIDQWIIKSISVSCIAVYFRMCTFTEIALLFFLLAWVSTSYLTLTSIHSRWKYYIFVYTSWSIL